MAPAAEWCAGVIHLHTTFSDGPAPAKLRDVVRHNLDAFAAGRRSFMIVTDHFETIAGTVRERGTRYSPYRRVLRALSVPGEFVAMPCLELASQWSPPGQDTTASSHLLALGKLPHNYMDLAAEYDGRAPSLSLLPDHQRQMIDAVRRLGMLPVAAHPSQYYRAEIHISRSYVREADYRFDQRPESCAGLAGIEVWNEMVCSQSEEDIAFYLRLVAAGRPVFVTTGADYHGGTAAMPVTEIPQREILKSLQRFTWVYADSLDEDGITAALAAGRTYAARFGARFDAVDPAPGAHVTSLRPALSATVAFPKETSAPKEFLVYRDGVLVEGSRQVGERGRRSYAFQWTDADARSGEEHSYVLRVGEVLLTSPIYIRVP